MERDGLMEGRKAMSGLEQSRDDHLVGIPYYGRYSNHFDPSGWTCSLRQDGRACDSGPATGVACDFYGGYPKI